MLDLDVPIDTPLFRAHLSTLSHTTTLLSKTCKSTLGSAKQVIDCLEALGRAEEAFFQDLERLDKVLRGGGGSDKEGIKQSTRSTGSGIGGSSHQHASAPPLPSPSSDFASDPIRLLSNRLKAQRALEKERMESMLMSKLRGTRDGLKLRGLSEDTALSGFEVSDICLGARYRSELIQSTPSTLYV
jgi:hypothetical protein